MSLVEAIKKEQEVKTPPTPKKRVNRFPILQMTGVPQFMRGVGNEGEKNFPQGYHLKSLINPKLPKIPYLGSNSYAMAAVQDGWYLKTGCCASIKTTGTNTRLVYYIPHVGQMSLKKKIAYINYLTEFFKGRVRFLSVAKGTTLTHPLNKNFGEKRISVSTGDIGVMDHPRSPIAVKEYITVYAKAYCQYDRLLYLQFLRPLYQTIPTWMYKDFRIDSTANLINYEYYQPQLFFRLEKWFPDLPLYYKMFLSFCIHGREISSTYFPYYTYMNGCKPKYDLNHYASINELLGLNRGLIKSLPLTHADQEAIRNNNFEGIKFNQSNTGINYAAEVLSYLVQKNTRESFKLAIKVLATAIDDKVLLELIDPQPKKIKSI